jgi:predicted outer membrane protein
MRLQIMALLLCAPMGMAAAQDSTEAQKQNNMVIQQQRMRDGDVKRISDSDVLAKMHKTNLLEIRIGQLAQRNGASARVKSFAARLVSDHQAADQKVTALAQQMGVTLTDKEDTDTPHRDADPYGPQRNPSDTIGRTERKDTVGHMERMDTTGRIGQHADTLHRGAWNQNKGMKQGHDTTTSGEHGRLARLATLRGAAFDSAFASAMVLGHMKTVKLLENAETQVQNTELKTLISNTLPTVREHLRLAQALPGGTPRTTSSRQ